MKLATFTETGSFNTFDSLMMANRLALQSASCMAEKWSLPKQLMMRLKQILTH